MINQLKQLQQNQTFKELAFFVPYFIYVIFNFLLLTTLPTVELMAPLSKVLLVITIGKIALNFLFGEFGLATRVIFVFYGAITLAVALFGGENFPIYFMILSLGAYGISAKKIVKYHFLVFTGLILLLVFLSVFGLIENRMFIRDNGVLRYAFGFDYPTDFAALTFFLYAQFIILYGKIKPVITAIIGIGLAYVLYVFVNARLDTIMVLAVLITFLIIDQWPKINPYAKYLIPSFIVFFVLSFVLAYWYQPELPIFNLLNNLLSDRLRLGNQAINVYGIPLLGQEVIMNGYGDFDPTLPYSFIDSSYLQLLLRYGLIYSLFISYAQIRWTNRLYQNRYYLLVFVVALINLHGMIAHHIFNPVYNPLWITIFALYPKHSEYLKEENVNETTIN